MSCTHATPASWSKLHARKTLVGLLVVLACVVGVGVGPASAVPNTGTAGGYISSVSPFTNPTATDNGQSGQILLGWSAPSTLPQWAGVNTQWGVAYQTVANPGVWVVYQPGFPTGYGTTQMNNPTNTGTLSRLVTVANCYQVTNCPGLAAGNFGVDWSRSPAAPPPAPSCYSDARAGWTGSRLGVTFAWGGSTAPADPESGRLWSVGYTTAAGTGSVTVVGYLNENDREGLYYSGDWPLTTAPVWVRARWVGLGAAPGGCADLWWSSTGSKLPDAGSGIADPTDGSDCSRWDLACQVKAAACWAFCISDETQDAFVNLGDTMGDKFPFSLVAWFAGMWAPILDDPQASGVHFCVPYPDRGTYGHSGITLFSDDGDGTGGGPQGFCDGSEPAFVGLIRDERAGLAGLVWILFLAPLTWAVWRWAAPLGALKSVTSDPGPSK